MTRTGGVFLDIPAPADDEIVDRPGAGIFVKAPTSVEHLLARYGFAFVTDQVAEDVGFHLGQRVTSP